MVRSRVLLCAAAAGLAVALAGCEPTTVYPSGGYVEPFYAGGYYGAPYYGGGYYGGGYGYGSGYYGGYRTGYYGGGVYHGGRGRDLDLGRDAVSGKGGASLASPEKRRS